MNITKCPNRVAPVRRALISRSKGLVVSIALVLLGFYVVRCGSDRPANLDVRAYIRLAKECVFRLRFTDGTSAGSGFMINDLGNMLTCAHVVDSSKDNSRKYVDSLLAENFVTVTFGSDTPFQDIITSNVSVDTVIRELDLAILTVDLTRPKFRKIKKLGSSRGRPLFMGFSNSDSIWEGQEVFACAYIRDEFRIPKPVIVKGVVSTVRDDVYDARFNNKVDIVQLDMNVSKGNSGAPIFLPENGRVVGIIDWGIFRGSKWQTGYAVALSTNQIVEKLRELRIPLDFK